MFKFLSLISILLVAVTALPRQFSLSGNRIVGGVEVDITERPFQIALNFRGSQICGGAIVNADTIITAAHCSEYTTSGYSIRAGSTSQYEGGVVVNVVRVIVHPKYNKKTLDYDVAIMKLAEPLTFSDKIQPVELAAPGLVVPDNEIVVVSGWGDLESGAGNYPDNLRAVEIPVVNQNVCNAVYGDITDRMLCAGIVSKDSCQGDSGGPLTYNGIHVGVVSWGYGCAFDGYPGVYSRTSELREFIDQYS